MKRADIMRIFYFDEKTGIYQGEDFADEAPTGRGVFKIPEHSTTIAPPPYKTGIEAPFFNPDMKKWEVRGLTRVRNN